MKKIEATIQPVEVEELKGGLTKIGIKGMTVIEVKSYGRQSRNPEIYRGMKCEAPFLTEAKVEIVVADDMADKAVAVIRETTEAGEPGESRIFVSPLEDIIRLRTEKKSLAAV
ncbi:MAG TPA: P-II family nitrogen regulator [Syntrophorhabdales bacterium]|nr:P-II family nitrogen regulator [Syntrophorhabdales bacterium]